MKNDPDKPLINRYTQGTYIPGSIVKMVTQVARQLQGKSMKLNNTSRFYQFEIEYLVAGILMDMVRSTLSKLWKLVTYFYKG